MTIFIKNMVCNRCITAVEMVFAKAEIPLDHISLGKVELSAGVDKNQIIVIDEALKKLGFERIIDSSQQLIQQIKNLIIKKIADLDISEDFILSDFVKDSLHKDYSQISKIFSQHAAITLEQYYILQKIEKVKDLLIYKEKNLTEIAGMLGYKSVQHLSTQFKNNTGFTPTAFKNLKNQERLSIDLL